MAKAIRTPWHPAALPELGFQFQSDGATFKVVHLSAADRSVFPDVWMICWETSCATCGYPVGLHCTVRNWRRILVPRQCGPCRWPGGIAQQMRELAGDLRHRRVPRNNAPMAQCIA